MIITNFVAFFPNLHFLAHYIMMLVNLLVYYHFLFDCYLVQWARDVGLRTKPPVRVPVQPNEHQYLVTKPLEGLHTNTPCEY